MIGSELRRLAGPAALVLLSLVVWWGGGMISVLADPNLRIVLVVAVLGGGYGWTVWHYRASEEQDTSVGAEIRGLGHSLGEVLGARKAKKSIDYGVPWYLLIGPPQSGKSTLARGLGLVPANPALREASDRGVGCCWFVGERAVIGDTAPRFTVDGDTAKADRRTWTGLLRQLRRRRPYLPLSGMVVAVSLPDLAKATEIKMESLARDIHARVREAEKVLGLPLPVTLVFTKLDLIPGFLETFVRLDGDDRRQPWGAAFAPSAHPPGALLSDLFASLIQRLDQGLLTRLAAEPDKTDTLAIVEFPARLEDLRQRAVDFAELAFSPDTVGRQPILQGAYLVSAVRELNRPGPFFVPDVLSRAAGTRGGPAYTRRRLWRLAGETALILAVGWFGAVALAGMRHRDHLRLMDFSDQVAAELVRTSKLAPPGKIALSSVADTLDRWKGLDSDYGQGDGNIARMGRELYSRMDDILLTPVLVARLEKGMRRKILDQTYLRTALPAYLALTGKAHFHENAILRWTDIAFAGDDKRTQHDLDAHIADLVRSRPRPYRRDADLVKIARAVLAAPTVSQNHVEP